MTPEPPLRPRLEAIHRAALRAVDPERLVRDALQGTDAKLDAESKLRVLAVGKAAAPMARAVESLAPERIVAGLVVAPRGHELPLTRLSCCEGAHPVPDARSRRAGIRAMELVGASAPDETLLVLLSGGASSLMALPAPGLELADLAVTTERLLRAGADIEVLNAVRKHLSGISGGRLGLLGAARRVEVLVVSDVPGDSIEVIGSGPFAGDASTFAGALEWVRSLGVLSELPPRVVVHLTRGAEGAEPETPTPDDRRLARVRHHLLATNATAREGARAAAGREGFRVLDLGPVLRGEARRMGARLGGLARSLRGSERVCGIAGGETVVTVRGAGRGGRSQELALAAALVLDGSRGCGVLAAGTDGVDGPTDAAGAYADGDSVARGRQAGVDAAAALRDNDAYGFFDAEGGLLRTGPTRTNVMDLALLAASPDAGRRLV